MFPSTFASRFLLFALLSSLGTAGVAADEAGVSVDTHAVELGNRPITLSNNPEFRELVGYREYYNQEHPPKTLVEHNLQFLPVDEFDYDGSRNEIMVWVRIPVLRTEAGEDTYYLHLSKGHFWKAAFYLTRPNGTTITEADYSAVRPTSNINDLSLRVSFPFVMRQGDQRIIYLRLKVYDIEAVALSVYPRADHVALVIHERVVVGILLGALLGLLIYNVIVLPSFRERSYGLFVGFLVAATGYIVTVNRIGTSVTNILFSWYPDTPTTLFVASGLVFAALFTRAFLRTRETMPVLHKTILAFVLAVPVVIALDLIDVLPHSAVDGMIALGMVGSLLVAGVVGAAQRRPEAVEYLLSMAFFCVGSALSILGDLGIRPTAAAYLFDVAAQLGIVLSLLFLSVSIAQKVRRMRHREHALGIARERESSERRRLEEVSAAKSDFLADASHELRAPLSCIRLAVEGLANDSNKQVTPDHQMLRSLLAQIDRLTHHVDNLLLRSRVDLPARHFHREPADLATLVDLHVAELRPLSEQRGVALAFDNGTDVPVTVLVDRALFASVIINLLDNAIRFTAAGGSIAVLLGRRDTHALITVTDTGCGIEPDKLELIFDRYSRVDRRAGNSVGGTTPGLGIGLSIVREIVELHGGTISATSEVGVGTTITIDLPTVTDNSPEALDGCIDPAPVDTPHLPASVRSMPTLLLVEDDLAMLRHLERLLSIRFVVSTASDLAGAKSLVESRDFDVVLSDVRLPDGEGFELCAVLRRREGRGDTPIVFLSGVADHKAVVRGLRCGGVDYVRKPFVGEELEAKLLSVVAARRRTAEAQRESLIRHIKGWGGSPPEALPSQNLDPAQIQRRYELTDRQINVLDLVMKGYTDSEIGSFLDISHRTVGHHVSVILRRVGVERRTQLTYELLSNQEIRDSGPPASDSGQSDTHRA